MPSSPLRYDKFSYAVKRRPEKDTPSPHGSFHELKSPSRSENGLQALALTRDGFAIAEDGSLMSRVVSPPRWTPGTGPVVFASTAPTVAATPARQNIAPPNSPATTVKGNSTAAKSADPWGTLVRATSGKLSEEELVMLSWDTVADLLQHFGITNAIDVGRVQLTWRRRQEMALGNDIVSDCTTRDPGSVAGTRPASEFGVEDSPASKGALEASTSQQDHVLMYTSPSNKALQQKPIMQIAYGRPASPRRGGSFVPDHKKPLNWKAESKVDTGRNKSRSSSRLDFN
jgi:hypothetical protein